MRGYWVSMFQWTLYIQKLCLWQGKWLSGWIRRGFLPKIHLQPSVLPVQQLSVCAGHVALWRRQGLCWWVWRVAGELCGTAAGQDEGVLQHRWLPVFKWGVYQQQVEVWRKQWLHGWIRRGQLQWVGFLGVLFTPFFLNSIHLLSCKSISVWDSDLVLTSIDNWV